MAIATPPVCDFDWPAPGFTLPGTDGQTHSFEQISGPRGTLIMFICNHCPFVIRVLDQLVRDGRDLATLGIGVAAICSNDADAYPADNFENMGKLAQAAGFPFPYLHDADQSLARAYGAECTPDFFGFNADGALQYRGNADGLLAAMGQIADTGQGPRAQTVSMGCSIKWKP